MADSADFDKLGSFYLGKPFDLESGKTEDSPLLYESKDLTTHGVCVGMTGSGKTGLCLALLEEAALDGIPAIAIDPKGDLGNLMLTFPELRPADFRPWIDPAEAARKGITPDEYAEKTATLWKNGLADWNEDGARIQRFKDAVDIAIYTPGSTAGLPLSVLKSFDAPDDAVLSNAEALRDRIGSSVSGLLALLGIDADPLRSREHILLSNLLDHGWRARRNLDMATLIRTIQNPPFDKVGVMDLESFYPAKDRFELSMSLNNLLASPGFSTWMEGEPLDVQRLLYTAEGKPRLSIISIAHLSDAERMFFVTLLLGEVIAWMRSQSGTSSLRALLYMDEVFGYFPPSANPPSKTPMLTLLKQARAYGLGVLLATQNPVDLDYKGLSNAGTWFLGRLQTERDKMRVLDGLEGASATAGAKFDRGKTERILSSLGNCLFLLNNVHEDQPVVMQTRWVLSYLRGPLTREQIAMLMADRKKSLAAPAQSSDATPETRTAPSSSSHKPILAPGINQSFLTPQPDIDANRKLTYKPALFGTANVHFVDTTDKFDCWKPHAFVLPLDGSPVDNWSSCDVVIGELKGVTSEPQREDARFEELPSQFRQAKSYSPMRGELKDFIYQQVRLQIRKCESLGVVAEPEQTDKEFRHAIVRAAAEKQAAETAQLELKRDQQIARLEEEKSQAPSALWVGLSRVMRWLGNLFVRLLVLLPELILRLLDYYMNRGSRLRKPITKRQLDQLTTAARRAGREEKAEQPVRTRAEIGAEIDRVMEEFLIQKEELETRYSVESLPITQISAQPRKSDIDVNEVKILWLPFVRNDTGSIAPAFVLPQPKQERAGNTMATKI